MQKRDAPSKKVQFLALVIIVTLTATIFGCRGEKPAEPAPAPVAQANPPASPARGKEQAMAALIALPELKAWSGLIDKSSGGKARGALVEYDPQPKLIDGKRYFQLSFVENSSDAIQRWEDFLVAETGSDILVEDAATDKTLTLEQWRNSTKPMTRISAN